MFSSLRTRLDNLSGPMRRAAAVLTGVSTLLAVFLGVQSLLHSDSNLALVHTEHLSSEAGFSTRTEIQLRNTGESVAFVKRADLDMKKVWILIPPYQDKVASAPSYAESSHDYDVKFPLKPAPYTASINLSQSIKPDDTDVFTINVSTEREMSNADYVFLVDLTLVYDEDDKTVSTEMLLAMSDKDDLLYYVPNKERISRELPNGWDATKLTAHNSQAVQEIEEIEAESNGYLNRLVREISGAAL